MFPRLLELGPSPSTPTACCWPPRTCWPAARGAAGARAGLDANRVLDLGIYIIIAALVGAKLLLLIVDFDYFRRQPAETVDAGAVRRRVLRRPDPRGRRGPLVHPQAPAAVLDDRRRVRAGHRARPRGRPLRLPVRRLLLRQADDVPWAITFTDPFAASNVGTPLERARCTRRSCTRPAPSSLILVAAARDRAARPAVRGPDVLALHAALRRLALRHRVLPRRSARG